ncbi:hypothetical protein SEA_STEAMY_73 [Mycobacterium phage Steamy]|uniref:Uncharacterized protein n=1 Tax=Mycobacterium phage Steamy TaxID=2250309 RepID=A0A345L0P5_9CAUD|nr:hypothetical protein KIV62_gp28 [Mycobacterium phage Steamy]AXH48847.1 hypothetical protein SEA_STEAMY_73 [Mycobacterium phage Steamy]
METTRDVRVKGSVFESRIVYGGHKIEVTTVMAPGWRKAHRKLAQREGFPNLWITHIEHEPKPDRGVVTTTWEN